MTTGYEEAEQQYAAVGRTVLACAWLLLMRSGGLARTGENSTAMEPSNQCCHSVEIAR